MLVHNIASLVVAREKTCGCYGTNMQKIWRKSFFDTRLELLGWEIGENDGKKTLPPICPMCLSPEGDGGLQEGLAAQEYPQILLTIILPDHLLAVHIAYISYEENW